MKRTGFFLDFLKKKLEYAVALFSFLLFFGISLTQPGVKTEFSMYDTLLSIKPEVTERPEILLLAIDDPAIEAIGAWPWTRDIIADMLIRLRESGGSNIVFDIEYLSPGQTGVNHSYVKSKFPDEYSGVHDEIVDNVKSLTEAIQERSIPLDSVGEYGSQLTGLIDESMSGLAGSITTNIFRDNDQYFAGAIRFFGKVYLTVNGAQINVNEENRIASDWAHEHLMFTNVKDPAALIPRNNEQTRRENFWTAGIAPSILPLLRNAAGAGFPNVIIDEDGVRRRIELLVEYEGAYLGQLAFSPILNILQPVEIVRKGNRLILKDALDPDRPESGVRRDLSIPLDENGRLLINWLKKKFSDEENPANGSFRYLSVYALKRCDEMEERLVENLDTIKALGIKNAQGYLPYDGAVAWLIGSYRDLSTWKEGLLDGSRGDFDGYFEARKEFFSNYGQFLDGGFDTEIYDTLSAFAEKTGDSRYADLRDTIKANFDIYRGDYAAYTEQAAQLGKSCSGSFCIIGYSGVGTSDLGVNPFHRSYANVGTHANIYNTIMTREFINPLPRWMSWLAALALCWISALAFRRIKSLKERIVYGIASTIATFVIITVLFAVFRIYLQVLVPLLSVFVTFLLVSILRFVFSEQEKSFLRKAFTMYLSSDVVNQIVADPSLLKLGGQEKRITALFTDIKSFSTLSEKVTPEHLVQILNKYLTVMSDIVLEEKGTIDKYIGDAIVSFFGAPLNLPDHAIRACLAAVRMKQAEERLNSELLASGEAPMPIYTRIGINTGAMVVGNMGTDNKMNYTIMGNDVNLAARLEGVNKQYGTWILVSEPTWNETEGMFLGRKLDRVRVVGIETPVQLYNILAVRTEASGKMVALVAKFDEAIDAYREKRFGDAYLLFTKCTEIDPDDAASRIFLERVSELAHNGVPDDWSDVINMTSK